MGRTIQEEYIFGGILLLANKLQLWGDGLLDELTLKQWFLLMLISKMGTKKPTVKEIADFAGTSRQNTKKMLELLKHKGYVVMNQSETDARGLSITLSGKTWNYFSANASEAAERVSELFNGISDEELLVTGKTFEKLLIVFGNPPLDLEAVK
jgi:DNA-binding MarR family transcriptional regulator